MHCTPEVLILVLSYWNRDKDSIDDIQKSIRLAASTGQVELIRLMEDHLRLATH